jgi:hypothetical protein
MFIPIIIHEDRQVTNLGMTSDQTEAKKKIIEYSVEKGALGNFYSYIKEFNGEQIPDLYLKIKDFSSRCKICTSRQQFINIFRQDFLDNYEHFLDEANSEYDTWHIIEVK